MFVARRWMALHRARSGTKNWCSSGSVHATDSGSPSAMSFSASSSKRSDSRLRKSRPKMQDL